MQNWEKKICNVHHTPHVHLQAVFKAYRSKLKTNIVHLLEKKTIYKKVLLTHAMPVKGFVQDHPKRNLKAETNQYKVNHVQ